MKGPDDFIKSYTKVFSWLRHKGGLCGTPHVIPSSSVVLCPLVETGKSSQVILLSGKCCGVYRKGLFIPIQNNHFPLKFCHISCSHSSHSTRIWHENYVKTKYKALYGMTYLSEYGHFGCFNSMGRFIDTLMIHLNFMQEIWIFSDYLKLMLLEYDGYIYIILLMLNLYKYMLIY